MCGCAVPRTRTTTPGEFDVSVLQTELLGTPAEHLRSEDCSVLRHGDFVGIEMRSLPRRRTAQRAHDHHQLARERPHFVLDLAAWLVWTSGASGSRERCLTWV